MHLHKANTLSCYLNELHSSPWRSRMVLKPITIAQVLNKRKCGSSLADASACVVRPRVRVRSQLLSELPGMTHRVHWRAAAGLGAQKDLLRAA